jgi:hypothetical protein
VGAPSSDSTGTVRKECKLLRENDLDDGLSGSYAPGDVSPNGGGPGVGFEEVWRYRGLLVDRCPTAGFGPTQLLDEGSSCCRAMGKVLATNSRFLDLQGEHSQTSTDKTRARTCGRANPHQPS